MCTPTSVWQFIASQAELGWKSVGVLELTALPSIDKERWVPWVRETDVLFVDGGDALYLCHWIRESGLADLLPSLAEKVWVGVNAGSMVMTPKIGEEFVSWRPPAGGDCPLGIVDFSIFPTPGPPTHAEEHLGSGRELGRRHRDSRTPDMVAARYRIFRCG